MHGRDDDCVRNHTVLPLGLERAEHALGFRLRVRIPGDVAPSGESCCRLESQNC